MFFAPIWPPIKYLAALLQQFCHWAKFSLIGQKNVRTTQNVTLTYRFSDISFKKLLFFRTSEVNNDRERVERRNRIFRKQL